MASPSSERAGPPAVQLVSRPGRARGDRRSASGRGGRARAHSSAPPRVTSAGSGTKRSAGAQTASRSMLSVDSPRPRAPLRRSTPPQGMRLLRQGTSVPFRSSHSISQDSLAPGAVGPSRLVRDGQAVASWSLTKSVLRHPCHGRVPRIASGWESRGQSTSPLRHPPSRCSPDRAGGDWPGAPRLRLMVGLGAHGRS